MPEVQPPPIQTQLTDIELFAKAYFNIELTSWQVQFMRDVIKGMKINTNRRKMGVNTATKVLRAYIVEGTVPGGRGRLPQHPLPPIDKKAMKGLTQTGRVLQMIKRPGGAYNYELSRFSLRYGGIIHDLRKDGHNIVTDRQYNKKGKATNTYRYRMAGQ